MTDFKNKTFIVTGGAQGIGRAIVEHLLNYNGNVAFADIDEEAGGELISDLNSPENLLFVKTDVGDEESVSYFLKCTVKHFKQIHGLVNNAGIARPRNTPIEQLNLFDWNQMIRTNLTGAYLMSKHASPHMVNGLASIVNISSTRALQSEAHTEAYSASKGGLVALTHAMAVSFANRIRVNTILPGWIDVSALKKRSARQLANLSAEDHLQHPAGRVGTPEDVAALAGFLLSEESGFITGQSFVIDGGMTKKMIYVD